MRASLLLATGVLWLSWPQTSGAQAAPTPLLGRTAPPIVARDVRDQTPVTLEALRGSVVVVTFLSPWCDVCERVSLRLERLASELRRDRVRVLGVTRGPIEDVRLVLRARGIRHRVALDDGSTFARYRIRLLPTLLVVDRRGIVREVVEGGSEEALSVIERRVRLLAGTRWSGPRMAPPWT